MIVAKLKPNSSAKIANALPAKIAIAAVEPGIGLRVEPVELEPLDAVDQEQPEQRIAAQGIDHLDAVVGLHSPPPFAGRGSNSGVLVALPVR